MWKIKLGNKSQIEENKDEENHPIEFVENLSFYLWWTFNVDYSILEYNMCNSIQLYAVKSHVCWVFSCDRQSVCGVLTICCFCTASFDRQTNGNETVAVVVVAAVGWWMTVGDKE